MSRAGSGLQRVLILPDTHAPYHDKRAWSLVMKVARAFTWDTCVLLGDFFDFYAVSAHSKDPTRVSQLTDELKLAKPLIQDLNRVKFRRKIITQGNHEYRMDTYLQTRAPELWDTVKELDLMGMKGWTVVPYREDVKLGRLHMTHDVGSNGALAVLNAYQDNVVSGHDHQMTYVVRGNAKGVAHVSATFGWLGDIERVDYMHKLKVRRNWVLGFGVGYLRPNGFIYLQPVPLVDYTCVVEGRLFL